MIVTAVSYKNIISQEKRLTMIIVQLEAVMGIRAPAGYAKWAHIFIGRVCKIVP